MGKQSKTSRRENLGKGSVTPIQIAFIVDRYLADNGFTNTLSAFRSEAAHLFSKTKGKEAPKGLMGLADILDEYIRLKEQRVFLDQEKRRVDAALRGIQDVMRAYYSPPLAPGSVLLPSSPPLLTPCVVAAPPAAPFHTPMLNPSNRSPPGHIIQGSPMMNYTQQSILHHNVAEKNFPTPAPKTSSANKRKASKSASTLPPLTKKSCIQLCEDSSIGEGNTRPSEAACARSTEGNMVQTSAVQPTSANDPNPKSPLQGSSIAKNLFKLPSEGEGACYSPRTPRRAIFTQTDTCASARNDSSTRNTNPAVSQEVASSTCSIISSKTIIVSPLKNAGFCAIERNCHITSSPLKSNSREASKREHIRGRLHFDDSDVPSSSEKHVDTDSSTSSTDVETQDFDFELPDLDILNGDFSFSQLFDLDIQTEGIPCQSDGVPDFLQGSEHHMPIGGLETNQAVFDTCQPSVTRVLSEETNIQGPDSTTTIRSVTKCIIMSPAKNTGNSSWALVSAANRG